MRRRGLPDWSCRKNVRSITPEPVPRARRRGNDHETTRATGRPVWVTPLAAGLEPAVAGRLPRRRLDGVLVGRTVAGEFGESRRPRRAFAVAFDVPAVP